MLLLIAALATLVANPGRASGQSARLGKGTFKPIPSGANPCYRFSSLGENSGIARDYESLLPNYSMLSANCPRSSHNIACRSNLVCAPK